MDMWTRRSTVRWISVVTNDSPSGHSRTGINNCSRVHVTIVGIRTIRVLNGHSPPQSGAVIGSMLPTCSKYTSPLHGMDVPWPTM